MATRKRKTKKLTDLQPEPDARAELDSALFLKAAQPVLKQLDKDLLARAKGSPAVTDALKRRHQHDRDQKRTADSFAQWLDHFVGQVAAAWLLSCVFVRTLEDRGLLGQARIAGPGATDSQRLFFEMAPSLTERDYLLTVFRELAGYEAARDLFDAAHNPVWLLAPSAEAAKGLLELFRRPEADAPAFRFGQADTRFLGDLYQDLDEGVRKRFALLQTPRFVESFILDRTLERAIERFGLDDTTLIDPTCGSGHFLLGAFDRLYDHRLRAEPGLSAREAAEKALDAVYGADINPYAVAIARFRLTLSFLEKGEYQKLADAPRLPLHLVVADSLLHNPHLEQTAFKDLEGQSARAWGGDEYALEDEAKAREVLHRRYAAVVGNPPYITVKDKVLRDRYRDSYVSAAGKYSLAAPFTERFFQLAREAGAVGMITANSFMKREFGKRLIEEYLPTINLETIINTSGAYIPGHGTPTVLLFGTAERPRAGEVLTVLASRGEPTTPKDPEQGHVWRSVADHWQEVGFENDYITVARLERAALAKHPWTLAGGGASELKELLEARSKQRLGELTTAIGFDAIMGEDDIFVGPPHWLGRLGCPDSSVAQFGAGEGIRDWAISCPQSVIFPYDSALQPTLPGTTTRLQAHFWSYRTTLINRQQFGKNTIEAGLEWYEYRSFYKSKRSTPLSITFAFVATHNHFVLDRGGKVFKQSAPIIKLPETVTEDDHLALLAYLNSSTACFWMKQVFYPKATSTGDVSIEKGRPEANRYEFAGTGLQALPLPAWSVQQKSELVALAREALDLAAQREAVSPRAIVDELAAGADLSATISRVTGRLAEVQGRLVAIQEDIDWYFYELFGLAPPLAASPSCFQADPAVRPFMLAGTQEESRCPQEWSERLSALKSSKQLRVIEDPVFKRLWTGRRGVFGHANKELTEKVQDEMRTWIQERVEDLMHRSQTPLSLREIERRLLENDAAVRILSLFSDGAQSTLLLGEILKNGDEVPFLSSMYLTPAGLEKHDAWRRTWDLQRRDDAGEAIAETPVPPKYRPTDFHQQRHYRLRGKLDVPKERFISYPGCESDEDGEPLYGWAGWDHRERAQALAGLYMQRKQEGWAKDRLIPMLAGLLELIPWLEQWHNAPDPAFDGLRLGDYYRDTILAAECRALNVTQDDLRTWRPSRSGRGRA